MLQIFLKRWQRWGAGSAHNGIFAALVTVGSMTTVVKLAAAAKVLLIARYYGLSDELDAFLIAFLIVTMLAEIVANSTSAALIPRFIAASEESREAGQRLLQPAMFLSACLCAGLAALTALAARPLLAIAASGFSESKLELTRQLMVLMLPVVVLGGVSSIWRSILNAVGRFALPAAAPALTPLATIVAVVAAGRGQGPYPLILGTLIGTVVEFCVVGWRLRACGWLPAPHWRDWNEDLRAVLKQYWPLAASGLVLAGLGSVDQAMAAMLGSGSVSALNYGIKVVNVAMAIGPVTMATAALPFFSRMVARREWEALRATLHHYHGLVLLIGVPVTLLLVWFSHPLVVVLFEGGAFTAKDTPVVVRIQQFYLLQAPFAILSALAVRLISSLELNRVLVGASAGALGCKLALNYALMQSLGVAGIALSTSLVTILYYGYLMAVLFRMKKQGAWGRVAAENS